MNNEIEFKFGDYAIIEQKRHGVPNEMFVHKVIGQLRSNTWVDVPVQSPATETLHDEMEDVCWCICCGVDETEVRAYRVKDMQRSNLTPDGGEVTALALTLEKSREASGCAAGVDLQDWVKKLAAENVALKAERVRIFNSGYLRGHESTVEGYYVDIHQDDITTYHEDVVAEISEEQTPATDRIVAGIKASAIPEGFKLVPEQMYLSDEDIQAICMQCGNGDKKGYGDYEDGILWVGELSNDGEMKYGLNIANANYPEEGSITVFEFDEPLREGADK
ncbi:TPA: hypothetical protein ACIJ17_003572 [Klebsiella aerogenes]